ncbi:pyridoxal-phosphate-dependent aminotransferase family protein [Boseongicola aestuarii]|uniref:Soluble hydrogenase 42 kDa subunit n=1 Tax=Boseongicola aestuarii TaxID=1470561 RepID=A0A238J3T1_9RHOB|nr:aminotransferase class V-fold PLP-dependent enzyme [Boseongicola aestuarii]SMX25348.1 Soluble hydrogenase 42 kDa subunit [Boseongicola aestuarii]
MSLGNGRHYLAIPGPSVIPDRVLAAMHRPAPNIYHGELTEMVPGIVTDLKAVARTKHHAAIYIANGHGVWEAAITNVFSRGDKVLVPSTGTFSEGWAGMARALGVDAEVMDFGKRSAIDLARLAERLAADIGHEIKAVMTVQVDTSTSVRNDVAALRRVLDEVGHPALLMIDCIACLGCDDFQMDAWGVDVMVTGCQKGLMTPPGMAFVFFNDKADRAREAANCVTPYWDWRPRVDPELFYLYFCGTAPTHHLYGLRAALDMIAEEGLDNVLRRHAVLARSVWAAFERWGDVGPLELNVQDPGARSHAVTSVRVGSEKSTALREWVEERAGLTLGIGLGMAPAGTPEWHRFFRVGHMGHVNAHMVLGALATIEAGLTAVGIEHASGGVDAAASIVAREA